MVAILQKHFVASGKVIKHQYGQQLTITHDGFYSWVRSTAVLLVLPFIKRRQSSTAINNSNGFFFSSAGMGLKVKDI